MNRQDVDFWPWPGPEELSTTPLVDTPGEFREVHPYPEASGPDPDWALEDYLSRIDH